jgi:hypothetical protein
MTDGAAGAEETMLDRHRSLPRALIALAALFATIARADEPSQPAGTRAPDGAERVSIGETIRGQLDQLQGCYNQRLERVAALRGKLVLRFDIERDGKVGNATAEGMNDSWLIDCVLDQVHRWQFEKPAAGATLRVAYPVVFKPA